MSDAMDFRDPIVRDLLHALGIDTKQTVSVEIRVAVNELVTVIQTRHITAPAVVDVSNLDSAARESALERFKQEIVKWKLVPVEDAPVKVEALG